MSLPYPLPHFATFDPLSSFPSITSPDPFGFLTPLPSDLPPPTLSLPDPISFSSSSSPGTPGLFMFSPPPPSTVLLAPSPPSETEPPNNHMVISLPQKASPARLRRERRTQKGKARAEDPAAPPRPRKRKAQELEEDDLTIATQTVKDRLKEMVACPDCDKSMMRGSLPRHRSSSSCGKSKDTRGGIFCLCNQWLSRIDSLKRHMASNACGLNNPKRLKTGPPPVSEPSAPPAQPASTSAAQPPLLPPAPTAENSPQLSSLSTSTNPLPTLPVSSAYPNVQQHDAPPLQPTSLQPPISQPPFPPAVIHTALVDRATAAKWTQRMMVNAQQEHGAVIKDAQGMLYWVVPRACVRMSQGMLEHYDMQGNRIPPPAPPQPNHELMPQLFQQAHEPWPENEGGYTETAPVAAPSNPAWMENQGGHVEPLAVFDTSSGIPEWSQTGYVEPLTVFDTSYSGIPEWSQTLPAFNLPFPDLTDFQ